MTRIENKRPLTLLEKVAVGTSAVVMVAFIGYWAVQIRSVIELLRLAYGW